MFDFLISAPITAIVNILTLLGVGYNIIAFAVKSKKENEIIDIIIEVGEDKLKAKYSILRKFVQRNEIKGILRDLLIKQERGFSIRYLSSSDFIHNILDIQKGKGNKIIIKCTEDEFKVFDKNNFIKI